MVGYKLSYYELRKGLVLRYIVEHLAESLNQSKEKRGTLCQASSAHIVESLADSPYLENRS